MERRLRDDQRGLTLVELLIALAIAAVVSSVVFGFMTIGAKTFASTSSEVNLQHESQLAFNQMQDLIIDTALGVTYTYIPNGGAFTDAEIKVYPDDTEAAELPAGAILQKDMPADAAYKKIYMYNEDLVYVVVWEGLKTDGTGNRLYYEEYEVDTSDDMGLGAQKETQARMADYMTSFNADLNDLEEKRIVRVNMVLDKNTVHYESSHNITIRNKIIINGKPGDVYTKDIPMPGEKIGAIISPVVGPGDTYEFAKLKNDAGEDIKQDVRWYMDESAAHHDDTDIDPVTGKLHVSPCETNESFKVKVYLEDGSDSRVVTVNLLRITNVSLSLVTKKEASATEGKNATQMQATEALRQANYYLDNDGRIIKLKLSAGDEFTLQAGITGTNLELLSEYTAEGYADPTELVWEVTKGATYFDEETQVIAPDTKSGKFTMKNSGIVSKVDVEIKAYSKQAALIPYLTATGGDDSEHYTGVWTAMTYQKDPDFYIKPDGDMERNKRVVFNIEKNDTTHIYLYDVTLMEVERDSAGAVVKVVNTIQHWTEAISQETNESNIAIWFPQSLDPYADYRMLITCYEFNKWNGEQKKKYYLPYNNYNINNIDTTIEKPEESEKPGCRTGVSNTITADLFQSHLFFDGNEECYKKIYTPRLFNDPVNISQNDTYHYEFHLSYPYVTNMRDMQADKITWGLYQYVNDEYVPYTDADKMFEFALGGNLNKIRLVKGNWNDNVPSRLYLIPTIETTNKRTGETKKWLMYKSYVEFINYNIKVPTEYTETEPNVVESKWENLYFPYPTSYADTGVRFPGVSDTDAAGKPILDTWYNSVGFSDTLKYSISKSKDAASGITYYYLKLYRDVNLTKPFAEYRIAEDGKEWIRN